MRVAIACLALSFLGAWGCSSGSQILSYENRELGPEPTSTTETFTVPIENTTLRIGIAVEAKLSDGTATLRLSRGESEPLLDKTFAVGAGSEAVVLPAVEEPTEILAVVELTDAIGQWEIAVVHIAPQSSLYLYLVSGLLVFAIVISAIRWVRRRFSARWRWLWVGAGLWFVAVALKATSALLLNEVVLESLEDLLPRWGYLVAGSAYVGFQSALFEVGLTIVAALIWRRLCASPARAINIGIGAGAFEAALVGVAPMAGVVAAFVGHELTTVALAHQSVITPVAWMVAPIERALTIPAHVASRVLIFYGVADKRIAPIAAGFALFMGIDMVGGGAHVAKLVGHISMWWIELAIVPFAVISLFALRWVIARWQPEDRVR